MPNETYFQRIADPGDIATLFRKQTYFQIILWSVDPRDIYATLF
jgi:hypothetical protein